MSFRYTLQADTGRLIGHFGITHVLSYYETDREFGPTESISAICTKPNERVLDEFRWGLLPFWARNAVQADGLAILANKSFDYLLKRQRCVIPCSAYYRYVPGQGKRKPERVLLHKGELLAMAGVYDVRISPQGEELRTCTILSVPALASGREEQLPILLTPEQTDRWLAPDYLDKRAVRDMVETIAETQPKWLPQRSGEPEGAERDSGWQPFPA